MVKVAIAGVSGYGGTELYRMLMGHPSVEIVGIYAHSQGGQPLSAIFPQYHGMDRYVEKFDPDKVAEQAEWVFLSTPSGVSSEIAPQLVEKGVGVIDLSGDFRLEDEETYARWYGKDPAPQKWLDQAVYGLTEIYRERIREADFIANPGCYPTATLLGLAPLLKEGLADTRTVIVDAKSGVSGAGRSTRLMHAYSEANENLSVYKVGQHQHTPEIERYASQMAGEAVKVLFTPHLTPMTRGIMCTMYVQPRTDVTTAQLHELYQAFYREARFVRVRPVGNWPQTKEVYGSNYCDMSVQLDERTGQIIVISVIDNLVKGAAGQAIQNLNVRMGWPEDTAISQPPLYP